MIQTEILIVGSGAAGLTIALNLNSNSKITVLSKSGLDAGSTNFAQGGIAGVLSDSDSAKKHAIDTQVAGADLCDPNAVKFTTENGGRSIEWLKSQGVPFSRDDINQNELHLTREGGHSERRIAHVDDATGKAIQKTLLEKAKATDNITLLENYIVIDLITKLIEQNGKSKRQVIGAYVLDRANDKVITIAAKFVVLATGGASRVYLYSSNPDGSTGDGIAMAWRAGCRVANMEFMQFHPTCLFHPKAKNFLISEAVRGEGGILRRKDGTRFMEQYDSRLELAPRDIVARAIDHEMKKYGEECVFLDITHQPADFIQAHFPTIYQRCLSFGFDMTKDWIPVVPAAHYTCGGVLTDQTGKTDTVGLYAVGETTFTGLHGANRLASNSLLECIVFGSSAATSINQAVADSKNLTHDDIAPWDESQVRNSDEEVVVSHNWQELRQFMWDYVGIVRSNKRLERAKHRVDLLHNEIQEYYGNFRVNNDLIELRNLTLVSFLIIKSAMTRTESRGLNYNIDYPHINQDIPPQNTILIPNKACL